MRSKYGSLSSFLLEALGEGTGFFEWPLEYSESWRQKQLAGYRKRTYYDTVLRMRKKGLVKIVTKGDKKFLALTRQGELEKLFAKAKINQPVPWDGKWRAVIFDIPDGASKKRDQLRWLLKKNNFMKLQGSVYISPYPVNRSAIAYLQQTGLMAYIRIMRIDELDNDAHLRKKFNLK